MHEYCIKVRWNWIFKELRRLSKKSWRTLMPVWPRRNVWAEKQALFFVQNTVVVSVMNRKSTMRTIKDMIY
jgi:hypothetical protein